MNGDCECISIPRLHFATHNSYKTLTCLQANNMSRTLPVEFAIFGMSRFLAKGCFQLMHVTPGLSDWAKEDELASGMATTSAKMQSNLAGKAIGVLREAYTKSTYLCILSIDSFTHVVLTLRL